MSLFTVFCKLYNWLKKQETLQFYYFLLNISLHKTKILVIDMTGFAFQHFLCSLWHVVYVFGSIFVFAVTIPYLNNGLY